MRLALYLFGAGRKYDGVFCEERAPISRARAGYPSLRTFCARSQSGRSFFARTAPARGRRAPEHGLPRAGACRRLPRCGLGRRDDTLRGISLARGTRGNRRASYTPDPMGASRTINPAQADKRLPALLPNPKRLTLRSGAFRLGTDTPIRLPAGIAQSDSACERSLSRAAEVAMAALLERTGIRLPIEKPLRDETGGRAIRCVLDKQAALAPRLPTARDAYRLRVTTRGIEIAAPAVAGLRHGLQTLCQLANSKGEIPALHILDQPDFRDRGIMLDVSRGKVPTRQTLEDLVDHCSKLRINVLMLYVEHTFAFRQHPEIGEGSSPLDAETILALDAYAEDRGVELIPCLQSLGHMEQILSLERYSKLAESDRNWSVSPSRPETYQLLGDLYDEFLPLFRSPRMNANCDEPFDLGRGQSAERAPEKSPGRLFADHVGELERLASRHGKQLMIWADFALKHPDHLDRIGSDVVLMDWWYETRFDFDRIAQLRDKGFEVWACPGTSSWNCLFPRIETASQNIALWASAGRRHGATGLLNTDWGDFGHYNALGVSLHGYAWGAQQAWSGDLDAREFDLAFAKHVFGETTARIGRLYRKLGAIHDAGFPVANGSALQYLYFDRLDESFFLQHGKPRTLAASLRKLNALQRDIDALAPLDARSSGEGFTRLARQEVYWAALATALSLEKSLAAGEYNAWRETPKTLDARARKQLARRLETLADRQQDQLISLRSLWLARSAISDFHKTRKRIRLSVSSLRRGAKRLRENTPPCPPKPSRIGMLDIFNEVRRAYGMKPR